MLQTRPQFRRPGNDDSGRVLFSDLRKAVQRSVSQPASGSKSHPWSRFLLEHCHRAWIGIAATLIGVVAVQGVQINEFMARNNGVVLDSQGNSSDWIEFYNDSTQARSMQGMRLRLSPYQTNTWTFPSGVILAGKSYLVIGCNSTLPPSTSVQKEMNTGQSLSADGGRIDLLDVQGNTEDSITYGFQLADLSVGRAAAGWRLLSSSTPGAANGLPAETANTGTIRLNEWLANPASGSDDWLEIYNGSSQPVDMGGMWLSSDPALIDNTDQLAPLSLVGAQGWLRWYANKKANEAPDNLSFSLSKQGGSIMLLNPDKSLVDRVDYAAQLENVSEGRLPDGQGSVVKFSKPTPEASNFLPVTNLWINEVLTHTDPPLEDAVEIFNPTMQDVDVSHWFLSNSADNLKKYQIPVGTLVRANGFVVLYEGDFKGTNNLTFNSAHGDSVYLCSGDSQGNLTGYRLKIDVGAAGNGVSFGRYQNSIGLVDYVFLAERTFGVDNPSTLAQFRQGKGASNAVPLVGPVVISEIMYHPAAALGSTNTDNTLGEYIELTNLSNGPVALFDVEYPQNSWRLRGEISYDFPAAVVMPARSVVLVVSFDPVRDMGSLIEFRQQYPGLPANAYLFGPYKGAMKNSSASFELLRPDSPQLPPHPDAGFVPYLRVEKITYADTAPWPVEADGNGPSLQRRNASDFANDPVNWSAGNPSPGTASTVANKDQDQDGMPDDWEKDHNLDPANPADARWDLDLDGMDSWSEWVAGTDPNIKASNFLVVSFKRVVEGWRFRFRAEAGRTYALESAIALGGEIWTEVLRVGPISNSGWIEVVNTSTEVNRAQNYYRIQIVSWPEI